MSERLATKNNVNIKENMDFFPNIMDKVHWNEIKFTMILLAMEIEMYSRINGMKRSVPNSFGISWKQGKNYFEFILTDLN